jgi:hypothetical protein
MSWITIFSCPKPFTTAPIRWIQENAIQSWKKLGPDAEVILTGNEDGVAEAVAQYGLQHLPKIKQSAFGTPLLSSIFAQARSASKTPLLAYVNTDLILMPDFIESILLVSKQRETFVIVGQRWDMTLHEPLCFSQGWEEKLRKEVLRKGRLHAPNGSDYFVFPRSCFSVIPDFAVGRSGWDNWMIYHARKEGSPVVDASLSICAVHQSHDYGHLPGGISHHGMPESLRNVELAGGRQRIFYLGDADYTLEKGSLRRRRFNWKRLGREAEVLSALYSKSAFWASVIHALSHPLKTMRKWRAASRTQARHKADYS